MTISYRLGVVAEDSKRWPHPPGCRCQRLAHNPHEAYEAAAEENAAEDEWGRATTGTGRPSRPRRRMGARARQKRRLPNRPGPAGIARLPPHARRCRRELRTERAPHRRRARGAPRARSSSSTGTTCPTAPCSCVLSRGFEQKEHRKLGSLSIGSAHAF